MKQQEYEKKKRECWEEYCELHPKYVIPAPHFEFIFDRAYALGKQEKEVEEMKSGGNVTISLHVAVIPCQEEFYMGVNASHEAYTIGIPNSIIPSDLLAVINGECNNKVVTNIAIMK